MLLEGMQLGRYRLLSLLGTGGMGEVYLGEDMHIRRQVAIKVTRAEATPYPNSSSAKEAARLFQREVRAIAMLDHPYILPLFDYGEQDMEATMLTYMVMPYRKEGSLSTWLRQRGENQEGQATQALTLQQVGHFVQQAALALAYSHAHSIVHQDVKPSNFLLRNNELSPDLPDLLLADFGVAKFTSASASMSQSSRGTPTYMAPEQWSGQPVAASDQYALAVMTYQLLTGSLPFQGRQEQVMYQHFHVEPQPPSARNRRISKEVDSIILRGLSKKPEERFPSIADFSSALQQAITTPEPSKAAPPVASGALPRPTNPLPYSEGDMRATVAISSQEATTGTTRTLNLPGGRRITVPIPSGLPDGQVIRLENQGETTGDGTTGALVLKIAVAPGQPAQALEPIKIDDRTYESNPSKVRSHAPVFDTPLPGRIGKPDRKLPELSSKAAIIILVLVVVLVGSSLSINYFSTIQTKAPIATTGTAPPYAHGNPVLSDPLMDNSQGHSWDEINGSCDFTNGGYQVSASSGAIQACFAQRTSLSNFIFEAQVTIVQGDAAGIVFRADGPQQNYYFYYVDTYGELYLYKASGHSLSIILMKGFISENKDGNTSNMLAIATTGSQIDLYINYEKVAGVTDSTYSQGEIGVAAYSYSNSTQAVFSNARVWTL
jgi:serine/threonine protein kinase